MGIQPEDEKKNYEAKYRDSTFKGAVKTLQSVSQRPLRSANNTENSI